MTSVSSGPTTTSLQRPSAEVQQQLERVFSDVLAALKQELNGISPLARRLHDTFRLQETSAEDKAKDLLGRFHENFTTEFPKLQKAVRDINKMTGVGEFDTIPHNLELLTKVSFLALDPDFAASTRDRFNSAKSDSGSGIDIEISPQAGRNISKLLAQWLTRHLPIKDHGLGHATDDSTFGPQGPKVLVSTIGPHVTPQTPVTPATAGEWLAGEAKDRSQIFFLVEDFEEPRDIRSPGTHLKAATLFHRKESASNRPQAGGQSANGSFDADVERILGEKM